MKYPRYILVAILILLIMWKYAPQPQLGGVKLGTTNPNVTQANIKNTICVSGYTATIRPPTSYTSPLKEKLCKQQNCGDSSKYELDHRIALTDGGAPADPNNLWLQPYEPRPGAHEKDKLEVLINKKICNYELTLEQGQSILVGNWMAYYNQYYKNVLGAVESPDPDDI